MNRKSLSIIFAAVLFAALNPGLFPAPGDFRITISGLLDWEKGEIGAATVLEMDSAGIRFPSGRIRAEEILNDEYLDLIKPFLFAVQVDSSSTVEDLLLRGELSHRELNQVCLSAAGVPPNFSADFRNFIRSYTVTLGRLSSTLIRHSQINEPARPLPPSPAADYTGIIIIADSVLPVHGRSIQALVSPCLFPKIRDTDMNIIYEKNYTDPKITGAGEKPVVRYAKREDIFRPTPSGLDPALTAIVGDRPLRIFARSVFGVVPTDPVIDRSDAMLILSSDNNRRLLREGRVVFVVNDSVLKKSM